MSPAAVKATVWLRVRPGSDGAMALAWHRYVYDNKLYDEKFCKQWTNMPFVIDTDSKLPLFATDVWPDYKQTAPLDTPAYVCWDNISQSLKPLEYAATDVDPEIFWKGDVNGKQCRTAGQIYKDTADPYTLDKAAEICWVPADVIEKAIKIYTDPPVSGIVNGVASDMEQIASQLPLGLLALDMIMGYVNKPGVTLTQNIRGSLPITTPKRPTVTNLNNNAQTFFQVGYVIGATPEQNAARIAALPEGMDQQSQGVLYIQNQIILDRLGTKNYKGLHYWAHAQIPSVLEAIKTGIPYKPRVWYEMSGNKLCMLGNAAAWYNVFDEIDFCVTHYPNLTSFHVEVADLVLPVEEWLEQSMIRSQLNYTFPENQVIHLGETVSYNVAPQKVLNATCKKLNDYIAGGGQVVLGAVGASVGAGPASPSVSSTVDDSETETERNSTFLNDGDSSKYTLHFPIGKNLEGGAEEDSVVLQQTADRFKAPDYQTLLSDLKYQQPDLTNPTDTTFVDTPETYFAYDQHLQIATDGLPKGFGTESRKCEVYCSLLIKMAATGFPFAYPREQEAVDPIIGQEILAQNPNYEFVGTYSPICQHVEPAESPIEGDPGYNADFPLSMTSGRVYYFHHGTMRHAPFIRELYPAPDVRMHPNTAEKYGLKHMDWVEVTSHRG